MMERMEDREAKTGPLCLCLWEDGGGGGRRDQGKLLRGGGVQAGVLKGD